jgi:formate hydrogenlyase subunit 6/NADH:ubiquinone oxidoreductase subunit I
MGYFQRIYEVSKSVLIGMNVTLKHMLTPSTVTTRQYVGLKKPRSGALGFSLGLTEKYHEKTDAGQALEPRRYERAGLGMDEVRPISYIPDRHRGIHYLETEKCIMCFQCSRACPVDCIDIEGTRDGDVEGAHRGDKVTLTRFTIDYNLCIFCDHCTIACPDRVKCIHMGPEFDFSSYNQASLVKNLLTDAPLTKTDRDFILDARREIDRLAEEKAAAKKAAAEAKKKADAAKAAAAAAKPEAATAAKAEAAEKPAAKAPPKKAEKPSEDAA